MRYREVPEHVGDGDGFGGCGWSGIEDASGSGDGERASGGGGGGGEDAGLPPRARNETEDTLSSHNPTRLGRHWGYQHWTWFTIYWRREEVGDIKRQKIK